MRIFALAVQAAILSIPAQAQPQAVTREVPEAPSMTSSATTLAPPISPGSSIMHEVPTPSVDKRTNTIGTGQKLTRQGGN